MRRTDRGARPRRRCRRRRGARGGPKPRCRDGGEQRRQLAGAGRNMRAAEDEDGTARRRRLGVADGTGASEDADEGRRAPDDHLDARVECLAQAVGDQLEVGEDEAVDTGPPHRRARPELPRAPATASGPRSRSSRNHSSRPRAAGKSSVRAFLRPIEQARTRVGDVWSQAYSVAAIGASFRHVQIVDTALRDAPGGGQRRQQQQHRLAAAEESVAETPVLGQQVRPQRTVTAQEYRGAREGGRASARRCACDGLGLGRGEGARVRQQVDGARTGRGDPFQQLRLPVESDWNAGLRLSPGRVVIQDDQRWSRGHDLPSSAPQRRR